MSSETTVGIDLGTTHSCVAYYDGVRPVLIPDNEGNKIIPSMVYFDPDSGEVSVGEEAYRKSVRWPSNLIRDAKRIIGRSYNDEFVQKFSKDTRNSMKVVNGKNDMAAFSVKIKNKDVVMLPDEIGAEILKYLMEMVEKHFARSTQGAVISVPAYFSNSQRKATKKAADMIGMNVMKLITEPTAGAVYYLKDKKSHSKVMVFDWGGGTLDISLLDVENDKFQVRAVYGDSQLGGRDIDEKLRNRFNLNVEKRNDIFQRKVLQACVRMKKKLSRVEIVKEVVGDVERDYNLEMTRREFEDLLKDIFDRVTDLVRNALEDSVLLASQIDQVVLVGGSSRIPKVRDILKNIFGEDKLKFDLNPDEAVACGASIQAALLSGNKHLENLKITDVTPLSLGTDVSTDLFSVIIEKNSQLPIRKSRKFVTCLNEQTAMGVSIYEGIRKMCRYSNLLGRLTIEGLPKKRAGEVEVEVTFNLNEDGILNVTATENTKGITKSLSVVMSEFRLSETKLNYSLSEARRYKHEDDTFEDFNTRRNDLTRKFKHILYDLDKITQYSERENVETVCKEYIKFAEILDFTEIDRLEARFKVNFDSIKSILGRYNMLELPENLGNMKI